MTILMQPLSQGDPEGWDILHDLCVTNFLDGSCYAFATALHEGLGYRILGLMQNDPVFKQAVIRHAAVITPQGEYLDARGLVSAEEVWRPFQTNAPYDIRVVTPEELFPAKDRTKQEYEKYRRDVSTARRVAETLWPEFPWKESLAKRAVAFAEELETLCRKHGLWIRGPVPASLPIISQGDEAETGYTLQASANGTEFCLERRYS